MNLQAVIDAQPEHPVYPKVTAELLAGRPVEVGLQLLEGRARMLKAEAEDPFRYGHEPEFWDVVDWEVARMRMAQPGVVLEILIMGGNRAAKTEFAAKRSVAGLALNAGWLACLLHADEGSSRAVQQKRVWKYLPPEWKPDSGKARKTKVQKMNYNELSGFTENAFALSNGSQCIFKFYSADVTAVEGLEFDGAWSDELIPLNWMEAMEYRLLTRAQKTEETAVLCRGLLSRKEKGELVKFPSEYLGRLYQGVHIVTFTPIQGYTATVDRFANGATTIWEVPAELLPIFDGAGNLTGHEMVPRVQRCKSATRAIFYFHTYDNAFGGNWQGMKAKLANEPKTKVKERAYGIPAKAYDTRFPLFSKESHVRPASWLPREATWYHICDPCPGRNFSMIWVAVNVHGQCFVAREWPQPDDYIPGVGNPGMWAEPCPKGRKDGRKADAQDPFGFGIETYKREIARVERELFRQIHPEVHPEHRGRIPVYRRIIDSRGGAAPSLAHSSPVTPIDLFDEDGNPPGEPHGDLGPIAFEPSSRSLTGEQGSTTINDGVELVNDLLYYDAEKSELRDGLRTFRGVAPRLYVCNRCENTIYALSTWTGADGQKGACKDFVDLVRYLAQAGPEWVDPGWLVNTRRRQRSGRGTL